MWARSYPRRADAVEVVGTALLKATQGQGHRQIAAKLGVPATTVRDWLRRARRNAEPVRTDATAALIALDPNPATINPTGSALGDMLNAVGLAIAAALRRFGSQPAPWQLGVVLTRAAILSPRAHPPQVR